MDTEQTPPEPGHLAYWGWGERGEEFKARVKELLAEHFPSLENPSLKPYLAAVARLEVEFGPSFDVFYQILEGAGAATPAQPADRQELIDKTLNSVLEGAESLRKIFNQRTLTFREGGGFRSALASAVLRDPIWATRTREAGQSAMRTTWVAPEQAFFLLAAAVWGGVDFEIFYRAPSSNEWARLVRAAESLRKNGFPDDTATVRARVKALNPNNPLYLAALGAPAMGGSVALLEEGWRSFCAANLNDSNPSELLGWAARWARAALTSADPGVQAAARARGLLMVETARLGLRTERAALLKLAEGDPPIHKGSSPGRVYDESLSRFAAAVAVGDRAGDLAFQLQRQAVYAARAVPTADLQNRLDADELESALGFILSQVVNGSRRRAALAARAINSEGWLLGQISVSAERLSEPRPQPQEAERLADLAWGAWVGARVRNSPEKPGWELLFEALDEARDTRLVEGAGDPEHRIRAAARLLKGPLAPFRWNEAEPPTYTEARTALRALFVAAPGTYRKHVEHLGKLLRKWYPAWTETDAEAAQKLHERQFSGKTPAGPRFTEEAPPLPSRQYDLTQLSYAIEAERIHDVVLGVKRAEEKNMKFPAGSIVALSSAGPVVKFKVLEPTLPARFFSEDGKETLSMGCSVYHSEHQNREDEKRALKEKPWLVIRRMYEEFDRECAPTKVTTGPLTTWMGWWEKAERGINSPTNRVLAGLMAALCRRALERAKESGAPLSAAAEVLGDRAVIMGVFEGLSEWDTRLEAYISLMRVAEKASLTGSLGLLRMAVEFAPEQWSSLPEGWKVGVGTPETLFRILEEAELEGRIGDSAKTARATQRAEAFNLLAAGDWRREVSERIKRARYNRPALFEARKAIRAGAYIDGARREGPMERWCVFSAAFDEVAAEEGGAHPEKLDTLRTLFDGAAGITYPWKHPVSEWKETDWDKFHTCLKVWVGVAPDSLAWGADHFSRVAVAAPPAARAKIMGVLGAARNRVASPAAPAPTQKTAAAAPRASRFRRVAETAAEDAGEVALRLVVERAREELAERMVAWSAVRVAVGTGAETARAQQAAFFASPAGRGLISYLLGLGWKAARGHASWVPGGELGDRIAREIRLQGGEDLVEGFYREVAAPLLSGLSGVGGGASAQVRIEAPAAAGVGTVSEETREEEPNGLMAAPGATHRGP